MSAPKLLPALLGGLFIGVLSSLPFIKAGNICCCLWVVAGGALAALLMQQNTPRPVTLGEGALVGLFAGLFGTVVWIAWGVASMLIFSSTPFDMAEFQRAMNEAEGMTPEAREALESLTPGVILAVGAVIWFVVSVLFATIGGVLGALIFKKKDPNAGAPPAPPTPTFTPPTFTPPAGPLSPPPFTPPPPPSPPPAPPAPSASAPAPVPPPSSLPPVSSWPSPPDDNVGDAPTMLIPARGPSLPPKPPAPPAPPSGVVPPPPDREPDSH
jgi:hypothetical protein